MKPIVTWQGDPVIFVVVNGGAGLILIGKNVSVDAQMPATSAFLFVRPGGLPAKRSRRTRIPPADEF